MGTEVFPTILTFLQIVLVAIIVFSVLVIIISAVEYKYGHDGTDKDHQAVMKDHIVRSLITIVIILIVYFLLSAIGPAFEFLFQ